MSTNPHENGLIPLDYFHAVPTPGAVNKVWGLSITSHLLTAIGCGLTYLVLRNPNWDWWPTPQVAIQVYGVGPAIAAVIASVVLLVRVSRRNTTTVAFAWVWVGAVGNLLLLIALALISCVAFSY
jgi:hypothetical protein